LVGGILLSFRKCHGLKLSEEQQKRAESRGVELKKLAWVEIKKESST